jgi:hypothetical protein
MLRPYIIYAYVSLGHGEQLYFVQLPDMSVCPSGKFECNAYIALQKGHIIVLKRSSLLTCHLFMAQESKEIVQLSLRYSSGSAGGTYFFPSSAIDAAALAPM